MTDAERLRDLAQKLKRLGDKYGEWGEQKFPALLHRIADLLDAVPPETLAAIKAGTWKAVPVVPTAEMKQTRRRDWVHHDREWKAKCRDWDR